MQFFWEFKIVLIMYLNLFVMNFHHFANIRIVININKRLFCFYIFIFYKKYNFTMGSRTSNQNIKIFLTNFYFHIWVIAKTWLNFLVDDLENIKKLKKRENIKKIIDVIIIITIYNSCVYLFVKWKKIILKYLNINL